MSATGVANLNTLVFVAASGNGLQIVDASDPQLPKVVATAQTGESDSMAVDVALGEPEMGHPLPITIRAYVADLNAGLCVVPITQTGFKVPPTVGTIARYPTIGPDHPPAYIDARGVTVTKAHVFVANGSGSILWIAPLNELSQGAAFWVSGGRPYSVVVQGSYAYLTVQGGNGLSILDLGDDPLGLPEYCYPSRYTGIANASSAVISGNHVFVGDSGNNSLWAVDISDPAGWRVEPNPLTYLNQPVDMAIAGHYAYIAGAGVDPRMTVVDISDPQRLNLGKRGHFVTGGSTQGVAVQGNHAYLATSHNYITSTLDIVDVSNPSNPTLEGQVEFQKHDIRAVSVAGSMASLAIYDAGLYLVDISNPGAPTARGTYAANEAASVAAVPGKAYLAGHEGLSIVDTSDSANPSRVGLLPLTAPGCVAVSGNWAFVAAKAPTGGYALHAVNATQPSAPVDEATYPIPSPATLMSQACDISVAGDYLCLADGEGGLYVYRINLPDPPTRNVYLPLVLRG